MPAFRLRRSSNDPHDKNSFTVILRLEDGYDLEAGGVSEHIGAGLVRFWTWGVGLLRKVPGADGRCDTREEALDSFRAAWDAIVTDEDIAAMRWQHEWTAQKYALWDAGYRHQVAAGAVHCPCGETFDPGDFDATKAHIAHIKGSTR